MLKGLYKYSIYTKVCGHPLKCVDSAISATPVADRCIKSSTQPYNLHRQTLAVAWPTEELSDFQRGTIIGQVSSSNFCSARTAPFNCKSWNCEVETSRSKMAQPQRGRLHKLTERDRRVLKHIACKNRLSWVARLTTEFQTASESNGSPSTVCRELH